MEGFVAIEFGNSLASTTVTLVFVIKRSLESKGHQLPQTRDEGVNFSSQLHRGFGRYKGKKRSASGKEREGKRGRGWRTIHQEFRLIHGDRKRPSDEERTRISPHERMNSASSLNWRRSRFVANLHTSSKVTVNNSLFSPSVLPSFLPFWFIPLFPFMPREVSGP